MRKLWTVVLGVSMLAVLGAFGSSDGKEDEVLARVGNEVITRTDFETRLKSFGPQVNEKVKDLETKKDLLEAMIKIRLFVVEAANKGLMDRPDVTARLKLIQDDFISQEYIRAYLAEKVMVPEEEVENYYKTNPEYGEREFFKAGLILVAKESEAKEILEALKRGEPFRKLAREKSIDPATKLIGGDMDPFERGRGQKEIEEAVAKLEKGQMSGVVKTKEGYAILKLEDRRVDPKPPFLKVRDRIVAKLQQAKLSELVEREVGELRKKIKIDVFYDQLKNEEK
jgi:peptidyl-prolyl cis-trans isomerase C